MAADVPSAPVRLRLGLSTLGVGTSMDLPNPSRTSSLEYAVQMRPRALIGAVSFLVSIAVVLLLWLRTREEWTDLEDLDLVQDARVTRFSQHCVAPLDGEEGVFTASGQWQLSSVVVVFTNGDSSPHLPAWPHGDVGNVVWDCTPQALPRHWRLNKRAEYHVVDAHGQRLDRSLDPELLPPSIDGQDFLCAPGQLTGEGFRQMVALGRRVADAYAEHLARIFKALDWSKFYVRSDDTRRCLASMVGFLMSLLAAEDAVEALGNGKEVRIHVDANSTGIVASQSMTQTQRSVAMGDHLLARWCHRLDFPCDRSSKCTSLEEAGSIIQDGEAGMCEHQQRAVVGAKGAKALQEEVHRRLSRDSSFSVFGVERDQLSELLARFLGSTGAACADALYARPPFASRLVFERWQPVDTSGGVTAPSRWRLLWNGRDISAHVIHCDGGDDASGCTYSTFPAPST